MAGEKTQKPTLEKEPESDRDYFGLGNSSLRAVDAYESDEKLRQELSIPVTREPYLPATEAKLHEIRERINQAGETPITAALNAEPYIPPHPSIEELGTSVTREAIPAMRAELAEALSQIDFSGEEVDLDDLKQKLGHIENLLQSQMKLLEHDNDKSVDHGYLDFLHRMQNEARIAREQIDKLDSKIFGRDTREQIVFAEFKIRTELQMMFPEEDPYELLENPGKLEQFIKEKFKIVDVPDMKLGLGSHLKSMIKGWRGATMVSIGGTVISLSGFLAYSITILESPAFLYVYPALGTLAASLVTMMGSLSWNWDRQKSLAQDMVKHVDQIKEKVKGKYFPKPNPKPQFNTPSEE